MEYIVLYNWENAYKLFKSKEEVVDYLTSQIKFNNNGDEVTNIYKLSNNLIDEITPDMGEIEKFKKEREKADKEYFAKSELRTYERLKKKFEK